MALTWDATACGDAWGELDDPVREMLIFGTMFVDMGRITEANAAEFYARLHLFEMVNGALLHRGGDPVYITPDDVRAAIGLHTNVYTTRWSSFMAKVGKQWRAEFVREFNHVKPTAPAVVGAQ